MAGAFPHGSLVDPMSHDDDYGGATVATITFDDHRAFGAQLKASQGRAGWKTSGRDTLLVAPSAIPTGGAPFDATAPAVPLADVHDMDVPEPNRTRDDGIALGRLDDLELFHRAVDGDDDTWDVLLGAFETHCLERGHRAVPFATTRDDDAGGGGDSPGGDSPDPTPPRRPRASTSKSTSGDERDGTRTTARATEATAPGGALGRFVEIDPRVSSTSRPYSVHSPRSPPSHEIDLDEMVRRWSVGELDGDVVDAPDGCGRGSGDSPGSWFESAENAADDADADPTFESAFDECAFATMAPPHRPLDDDDEEEDDDASPPRLLASASSGAGHASHVLRSLIFGKGVRRRGKPADGKVRKRPGAGCGRGKRSRRGLTAKDAVNDGDVGVGVARGRRLARDGDEDNAEEEEEEEAAGAFAARNPRRWAASESAAATSEAVDADVSAAIHAATQSGAGSGTIAATTRALASLRNGIADELVTLSRTEARLPKLTCQKSHPSSFFVASFLLRRLTPRAFYPPIIRTGEDGERGDGRGRTRRPRQPPRPPLRRRVLRRQLLLRRRSAIPRVPLPHPPSVQPRSAAVRRDALRRRRRSRVGHRRRR